jgi:RNA polymerase sigma-54 factor
LIPEHGTCPVCSIPSNPNSDEPVVFLSPRDEFIPKKDYIDTEIDDEPYAPAQEELPTYVLRQIAPDLQPDERGLAAFLLTHLDEDGFLTTTLTEVAQYTHAPLELVKRVQRLIQRADPVGVGSLNTREALLVQIESLEETGTVPPLTYQIVDECMDLLSHHQYAEIAHKYDIPQKQVTLIAQFISENLNPFPGRSHWGDVRQPNDDSPEVYHRPDILISFLN